MAIRNPFGVSLEGLVSKPSYVPPLGWHSDESGPPPTRKSGFFGEGGMGRILAGAIGDALLQNADMAPIYAPMMRQRQQMAAEEAKWTRQRQAQREDKQWEWQNKPPEQRAPTPWEDNAGNRWITDPVTGENKLIFVDRAPKNIIQDGMLIPVPNPYAAGKPPIVDENLWKQGVPLGGGGASNGTSGFRW